MRQATDSDSENIDFKLEKEAVDIKLLSTMTLILLSHNTSDRGYQTRPRFSTVCSKQC